MDLLYWSRHFRNMPGEGDLPVRDFMRAVAATGYDGYLSLEIFNDQFRGGSPKAISVDGQRSLVWLMDQVRRAEPALDDRRAGHARPHRRRGRRVRRVRRRRGRRRRARPRCSRRSASRKPAGTSRRTSTLYRQGDINIVVNTEREGFAHSSFVVHGTSAYAIGLKVEDAAATVARAAALGAELFEQPVGPGELRIPAIRGVGGGVIYFLDGKTDLAQRLGHRVRAGRRRPAPAGAGLTRIDHVGQTMNYDEMLTWLLFYTSIFRTRKTPMVDVVDPGRPRAQPGDRERRRRASG